MDMKSRNLGLQEATSAQSRLLNSGDEFGGSQARQEREWKQRIHDQLMQVMDLSLLGSVDENEARAQIREICQRLLSEHAVPLNVTARQRIIKEIEDEILGLGPLEPLLQDTSVADILVNGHDTVYVERYGKLNKTDVRFRDNAHLLDTTRSMMLSKWAF